MDRVLVVLLLVDLLFLGTGGLLVGAAVRTKNQLDSEPTLDNVAANLLLARTPWVGAIANGSLVFVAFLVSVPGLVIQTNRGWLKAFGWMIIVSAVFTLSLGLDIWFSTLKTRSNLRSVWAAESPETQSLLQQRFDCCGYIDAATPPYRRDGTCPNAFVAAQKAGCVGGFSDYANHYLDRIFTLIFGMVALDFVVLVAVAVLLKERLDRARFRLGDLKHGLRGI